MFGKNKINFIERKRSINTSCSLSLQCQDYSGLSCIANVCRFISVFRVLSNCMNLYSFVFIVVQIIHISGMVIHVVISSCTFNVQLKII